MMAPTLPDQCGFARAWTRIGEISKWQPTSQVKSARSSRNLTWPRASVLFARRIRVLVNTLNRGPALSKAHDRAWRSISASAWVKSICAFAQVGDLVEVDLDDGTADAHCAAAVRDSLDCLTALRDLVEHEPDAGG